MQYDRKNPFMATLTERYSLCKPGNQKNTQHVVLDLKGSGIEYKVGDSIAVFPEHDPKLVEKTLKAMKAKGDETIIDKRSQESWILRDYILKKANIKDVSRKFLGELASRQTNEQKKKELEEVIANSFKEYISHRELWDILEENQEVTFSPQELCDLLMPLMPRFYSIASSMKEVGDEVHLTVAFLLYETNEQERLGVCTHYLCNVAPLNQPKIPIYIHPTKDFTLPEDPNAHIIMVGPGTGIAPYRGFMQDRMAQKNEGKNWLFFGEWRKEFNFFYEEYWKELIEKGSLRLETAFSRDQEKKVYVQHLMEEHGKELYEWLKEGAYFYLCGDATVMAKDVDATLVRIFREHGKLSEEDAKASIKKLRADKRYLRDVY